jgi:hypothetical protein
MLSSGSAAHARRSSCLSAEWIMDSTGARARPEQAFAENVAPPGDLMEGEHISACDVASKPDRWGEVHSGAREDGSGGRPRARLP